MFEGPEAIHQHLDDGLLEGIVPVGFQRPGFGLVDGLDVQGECP
jgi:hypothetical protein